MCNIIIAIGQNSAVFTLSENTLIPRMTLLLNYIIPILRNDHVRRVCFCWKIHRYAPTLRFEIRGKNEIFIDAPLKHSNSESSKKEHKLDEEVDFFFKPPRDMIAVELFIYSFVSMGVTHSPDWLLPVFEHKINK